MMSWLHHCLLDGVMVTSLFIRWCHGYITMFIRGVMVTSLCLLDGVMVTSLFIRWCHGYITVY